VRIDRSDLADKPDDAHMAPRRTRSTPDDLDAAVKDQGNAGASDGPPGSDGSPSEVHRRWCLGGPRAGDA
jgi:hypothetical protein